MDEDTLIIPASWRRRLHPRRGGTPGPVLKLDPAAGAALRTRIKAQAAEIDELLGNPRSDPGLVAAARRHLGGDDDPLGAAVVGQIVIRREDWRSDPHSSLVDAWCAEHGAAFAAAAVAGISKAEPTWRWVERGKVTEAWVRLRDPEEKHGHWFGTRGAIRRIRAVLAVAEDTEYEQAVTRLAECRDNFLLRLVTAYMVPTRQDWVNECLAEEIGQGRRHRRRAADRAPGIPPGPGRRETGTRPCRDARPGGPRGRAAQVARRSAVATRTRCTRGRCDRRPRFTSPQCRHMGTG